MLSKIRLWMGRKMPQITKHFNDGNISFDANFIGWRQLPFSKYIPFGNWDKPKIRLTVRLVKPLSQEAVIERIEVKCDSPDASKIVLENFGWSTNNIYFGKPYIIVLPALDRIGEYKYGFSIAVYQKLGYGSSSWSLPEIPAKLMSTGQIYSKETTAVIFITIIITTIVTFVLTEFGHFLLSLLLGTNNVAR